LGSAVVSTAVFGVPPKTFLSFCHAPIGVAGISGRLAGETPARATGRAPNYKDKLRAA
jgi:hypothetical protein